MQEYPNIRLICHSENKHQGGARNTGIRNAKGDWMLFVDSDDKYITNSVLKTFKNLIDSVSEDVSFFTSEMYTPFEDSECRESIDVECKSVKIINGHEVLDSSFNLYCVWNGCWKKQFLIESNIKFREYVVFEDTDFGIKAALYSAKIGCVEYPFYGYRYNPESITNKPRVKSFQDNLAAAKACYGLIKSNELGKLAKLGILKRIKGIILSFPKYSRNYRIADSVPIIQEVSKSEMLKRVMELPLTNKENIVLLSIKYSPFLTVSLVKLMILFKRKVYNVLRR